MRIDIQMLEAARRQFCLDTNMPWEEYLAEPHRKVYIHKTKYQPDSNRTAVPGARVFEKGDDFFRAIMCMGQLFLMVDEQIYDWALTQFGDCNPEWFCKYDNLRKIDDKLWDYDREIRDTHIYYLPQETAEEKLTLPLFPVQWFGRQEIMQWKENNQFNNAMCFSATQPDMLAVAAMKQEGEWAYVVPSQTALVLPGTAAGEQSSVFQNQKAEVDIMPAPGVPGGQKDTRQANMAGMAGISGDGEYLWQIGIDVIPEQRGWGLATNLVKLIKEEIIRRGKIPFYGTSESHTISQSVALQSGFVPAWTEIYVCKRKGRAEI